jgi:hypothetical protein
MRALFLLFLLLQSGFAFGEDISGKWTGIYSVGKEKDQPYKIVVELKVYQDSLLSGTSHLYYANGDNEHYAISGQYFSGDSSVYFKEDSFITVGKNLDAYCRGSYVMKLSTGDGYMRFDGRRKPLGGAFGMEDCPTLNASLEKSIPKKLPAPKPVAVKDKNLERKEEVQKLIEITSEERDSIKIELVDNAQIDNDVVSVYLNDDPVLKKYKLTATPEVFWISMNRNLDIATIRLAAESMGSVPPCTALLTVTTSKTKYLVTLSSDFGNTGILKLFLKDR